ncbi:MAG: dockerin type I domain-containing protein [Acutalibacteraceae bacterium]
MIELTDTQLQAADVNGDGQVTTADAIMIQKYVANIITSFDFAS